MIASAYFKELMPLQGNSVAVSHLVTGGKSVYNALDGAHRIFDPTPDAYKAFTGRSYAEAKRKGHHNKDDIHRLCGSSIYTKLDTDLLRQDSFKREKIGATSSLSNRVEDGYLSQTKSADERKWVDRSIFASASLGTLSLEEDRKVQPMVKEMARGLIADPRVPLQLRLLYDIIQDGADQLGMYAMLARASIESYMQHRHGLMDAPSSMHESVMFDASNSSHYRRKRL